MKKVTPSKNLKNISLLFVEDDPNIMDVFGVLLKRYINNLYEASNGKEGIELFERKKPDVVLSDIKMPYIDGLQMSEKIKEISPQTPIILITAFSDIDYLKRALEIGVEGFITKPVDTNLLLKKLNFVADAVVSKKETEQYFRLLQIILDENSDPVVLIENDKIVISNKVFRKIFGEKTSIYDITKHSQEVSECRGLSKYLHKEIICTEKGGMVLFFEVTTKKVGNYILKYFKDITDYRNEAFVDELTGVYNRKYLKAVYDKFQNNYICILMCDIDNFKSINDTYGHQVGDLVLKRVAETLKSNLRKSDAVIRYGGEEFLIYLYGVDDMNIAYNIAEFLRKKIENIKVNDQINITCSFGVGCLYIRDMEDFNFLIKSTDKALYRAKFLGKNRTAKMNILTK